MYSETCVLRTPWDCPDYQGVLIFLFCLCVNWNYVSLSVHTMDMSSILKVQVPHNDDIFCVVLSNLIAI